MFQQRIAVISTNNTQQFLDGNSRVFPAESRTKLVKSPATSRALGVFGGSSAQAVQAFGPTPGGKCFWRSWVLFQSLRLAWLYLAMPKYGLHVVSIAAIRLHSSG